MKQFGEVTARSRDESIRGRLKQKGRREKKRVALKCSGKKLECLQAC